MAVVLSGRVSFLIRWLRRLCTLASKQRPRSTRQRWTGCDLTCDEVGLLLDVYSVFVRHLSGFLCCVWFRARPAAIASVPAHEQQPCCSDGEDEHDGSRSARSLSGGTWCRSEHPIYRDGLAQGTRNIKRVGTTADDVYVFKAFQKMSCRSLAFFGRDVGESESLADVSCCRGVAGAEPRTDRKGWRGGGVRAHLPPEKRTIDFEHHIFAILCRTDCSSQEHIVFLYEQLPENLRSLLGDTDLVRRSRRRGRPSPSTMLWVTFTSQ